MPKEAAAVLDGGLMSMPTGAVVNGDGCCRLGTAGARFDDVLIGMPGEAAAVLDGGLMSMPTEAVVIGDGFHRLGAIPVRPVVPVLGELTASWASPGVKYSGGRFGGLGGNGGSGGLVKRWVGAR